MRRQTTRTLPQLHCRLPSCYKFLLGLQLLHGKKVAVHQIAVYHSELHVSASVWLGNKIDPPLLILYFLLLLSSGLPWGRNFYLHTHLIPTENPVGIPTGSPYPQNPKILHTHTQSPVFSLQEAYFNLLFVTLTVGYYMKYVLCESVCD